MAVGTRSVDHTESVAHTVATCMVVDHVASSSQGIGSGLVNWADGKGQHQGVRAEDSWAVVMMMMNPIACQTLSRSSCKPKDANIFIRHVELRSRCASVVQD